jgi:hypothetical protein
MFNVPADHLRGVEFEAASRRPPAVVRPKSDEDLGNG